MLKKLYYSVIVLFSFNPVIGNASKIKMPFEKDATGTTVEINYGLPTTDRQGIPAIIANVISYAAGVAATVAVVALIYAAFSYLTSGGDDEKAKKAKMMIVWTIVGLLILIFSWSIVNILLGLDAFSTTVGAEV